MAGPVRSRARGGRRTAIAVCGIAAAAGASFLVACGFLHDPSGRVEHTYVRKDGRVIKCLEPPPDVVPAGVRAEIDARISEILDAVNARVGVEETFARIRPSVPSLQAVEALEFRICAAWAQGILDERGYREFLTRILPLLRQTCRTGAEVPPDKRRTGESKR